ncbi:MAG: MoaD/ThiS family protein [Deltaproteobacteria bacterium]|nr:MoaD/ThiS family protein [Deltaproteobacteria bacterium]
MTIKILCFGSLKEAAGFSSIEINHQPGQNVSAVFDHVFKNHEKYAVCKADILYAVNQQHVPPNTPVHDGDEVALMPPLAGG